MTDPCATRSSAPLVSIENATVDIQGNRVVEDVSWALFAGQHWGIVGANGSGKSTLLRLIDGTIWPVPGRGRRRYDFGSGTQTDAIQARSRIATVGPELQNRYARHGWNFRTIDVVRSGLTRSDVPHRDPPAAETESARRIIERLGLEALAGQRFLTLSRGQQRRVLIARAVGFAPDVLLLDEPASGLDSSARRSLELLLAEVAESTTLVVTAHSEDDLPALVTQIARIRAGRLTGSPAAPRPNPERRRPSSGGPRRRPEDTRTPPLIDVRNASVYYDGRAVLSGIDWQLRGGEQWLITGVNGSGKSTFLRLLHGALRPAVGGTLSWPGLGDPPDIWALRRQLGFVSAELIAAYRYPVTVREAVGSGIDSSFGLVRRLSAGESATVDTLLTQFELDGLANRSLQTLSYGQLHRTMIARTLASGPRIVLLDEPWEGLDPATRALVARVMNEAIGNGLQIVCASHVDDPGLRFTDRLTIADGRISDGYAAA